MVLPFSKSRTRHSEIQKLTGILCVASPRSLVSYCVRLENFPHRIGHIVPSIAVLHEETPLCVFLHYTTKRHFCRQCLAKSDDHAECDDDTVPCDVQPFYVKQVFNSIIFIDFLKASLLFDAEHPIADSDVRLYVLLPVFSAFQLFTQGRHEHPQRSNIVFPTAAPNLLCDVGVGQNLAHIF